MGIELIMADDDDDLRTDEEMMLMTEEGVMGARQRSAKDVAKIQLAQYRATRKALDRQIAAKRKERHNVASQIKRNIERQIRQRSNQLTREINSLNRDLRRTISVIMGLKRQWGFR